jgi:hypothetical protein
VAQRQALQARRAIRRHEPLYYTAILRRRCEGSEAGVVIFRRQLSCRLQAHVGHGVFRLFLTVSSIVQSYMIQLLASNRITVW